MTPTAVMVGFTMPIMQEGQPVITPETEVLILGTWVHVN